MRFPFVSRAIYDELRAEKNALQEKYDALLVDRGRVYPIGQIKQPSKPPRDPMLDKMTADLEGSGLSSELARVEAARLKREAMGG